MYVCICNIYIIYIDVYIYIYIYIHKTSDHPFKFSNVGSLCSGKTKTFQSLLNSHEDTDTIHLYVAYRGTYNHLENERTSVRKRHLKDPNVLIKHPSIINKFCKDIGEEIS